MSILQTHRQQQAANRWKYAQKQQAQRESEENQQQFSGRILGVNAETGTVSVRLENGGEISAQSITSGHLKPGASAIVTFNGNQAWVDGMPN